MIIEVGICSLLFCMYNLYLNKKKIEMNKKINKMCYLNSKFTNKEEKIKLIKYNSNELYEHIELDISKVLSFKEFKSQEDFIKTFFKVDEIIIKEDKDRVSIDLFHNSYKTDKYKPVKLNENEVFTGYSQFGEVVKVNMNDFPHMLISGDTGTGKSRFLFMLLTNLIANSKNVDLYIAQIRKSDLRIFKDTKQVKYMSNTLEDTKEMLNFLNNECKNRESVIDKYLYQGIYNISDYKEKYKHDKTMNYIYIVLEEFSYFSISKGDSKEEKQLKEEILGLLKQLINVGRSVGIFIITALQKPTNDSIPTNIRNQLTTRVAFRLSDKNTSMIILNSDSAVNLKNREAIIRTVGEQLSKITFINHDIIIKNIKPYIEQNKRYININNECTDNYNYLNTGQNNDNTEDVQKTNNLGIVNLKEYDFE